MRLIAVLLFAGSLWATECIPMEKTYDRVGAISCVRAQVVSVSATETGTHFLNFCPDYRECPFTVVVFRRDLRQVGDVRELEGKPVEIHGKIQLYDGVPEIILRESRQLRGVSLPPVPKDYSVQSAAAATHANAGAVKVPGKYDVERRGKQSAGTFRNPQYKARKHRPRPRQGADTVQEEE